MVGIHLNIRDINVPFNNDIKDIYVIVHLHILCKQL